MYPRVAGIDVGKKIVAVAVRTPGQGPGQRHQQVRKFKTFYPVLQQMVGWLVEQGVTHVAMEATGVYCREAPGRVGAALTTTGQASTARWPGSG